MKERFEPGCVVAERYRIERKLGEGGMGAVYLAEDLRLGRQVALKALTDIDSDERRARFAREALAIARLSHRNIVAIFDTDTSGSVPFTVMEHIVGSDLAVASFERAEIFLQSIAALCDGLAYAHGEGVVHRDIKPENVLLDLRGEIKIVDFGLALFRGARRVTSAGAVAGTFPYLAPELIMGEEPSPASDQYAVGVLLFEFLGGTFPFPVDRASRSLQYRVSKPPIALAHYRPDLPGELCAAIDRSISLEPGDRFRTLTALKERLVRAAAGLAPAHGPIARPTLDHALATQLSTHADEPDAVDQPRARTTAQAPALERPALRRAAVAETRPDSLGEALLPGAARTESRLDGRERTGSAALVWGLAVALVLVGGTILGFALAGGSGSSTSEVAPELQPDASLTGTNEPDAASTEKRRLAPTRVDAVAPTRLVEKTIAPRRPAPIPTEREELRRQWLAAQKNVDCARLRTLKTAVVARGIETARLAQGALMTCANVTNLRVADAAYRRGDCDKAATHYRLAIWASSDAVIEVYRKRCLAAKQRRTSGN